jgi:hypothetical protein
VDPALGPKPAVRPATIHGHRDALEAGLLALELVHDLRVESVTLGPAEVHPQEHLRPIRGFGAADARADRKKGAAFVVRAREQEGRAFALERLGK